MEAQDFLSKKSQDTKILLRALRLLPRLKNVTVVFENEIIGAREIMSAFGLLNGNEITFDSEYTLPVLIEALSESDRKLDKFNLFSDESTTTFEMSRRSRRTFNYSHGPRFKYVSGGQPPTNVTAKAFMKAFLGGTSGDGSSRQKVITLMHGLREFNMSGVEIDNNDIFESHQWSEALEPIVACAYRLEGLDIDPYVSGLPERDDQRLHLSSILHKSISHCHLKRLELQHVESPESLLLELLTKSSYSLVHVALSYVRINSRGTWSDVFRKARKTEFKVLQFFVLVQCAEANGVVRGQNEAKGVVRAQRYLKRITDEFPVAECNENQDDSD